jgi:acyl-CoA synthetase (AMP-forming)/AMP-acid ligase II
VVLRHSTVLAGLRSIGVSARITPDDVFIQWVPHFHDMGLFGWLAPQRYQMPPFAALASCGGRRPGEGAHDCP